MCVCGAYQSLPCQYGDPKTCPNNTTVPAELKRIADLQKKRAEESKPDTEVGKGSGKSDGKGGKPGKK